MKKVTKPTAHLIIGFIGAGKTTFAKKLEVETGAVRFTKDEWMVRLFGNKPFDEKFDEYDKRMTSLTTDMALRCLKAGLSIILDDGFWTKEQRNQVKKEVAALGGVPKFYYLATPLETMKARTLERSRKSTNDSFIISEEQFDHYWKFFEAPDDEEEYLMIKE